ncbi:MAG TPA: hypothetical protein VMU75_03020 [Acidimicrobiales bacterium]|nr:hypothetical protein [Acidimicrobiales bacterium]
MGTDVLSRVTVRALASYRGDPVVTSFYLDVDGRRFPRPSDLEPKVEHLFRVARHEAVGLGSAASGAVGADLERIRVWLSHGVDRERIRGVAVFCCDAKGLFTTIALSQPFADAVSVDERPHVAQLVQALGASTPSLVVLVDREGSRLLRCDAGVVDESAGPTDELARQVDTDVELGSFARQHEEAARRHLRRVADAVASELRSWRAEYVVLGGPAATELEHLLPADAARRCVGVIPVAMAAPKDEAAAMAQGLVAGAERRRQCSLVEDLIVRSGTDATIGLAATLDALAARSVGTLVVDRSLKATGVRCAACGLLALEGEVCSRCGERTTGVADLVEAALADALAADADVESVDSPDLVARGGIGSIERY